MYPLLRLIKGDLTSRNAPPLPLTGTHVSYHLCWPWDIDPWAELNNGRTLTLYDLGRVPLANRTGLRKALTENNWGMTVAGSSVRYRRRVRMFDRVRMHSRCIGWDHRFLYIDQSMWNGDICTSQALLRTAITSRDGIVDPSHVAKVLNHDGPSPDLPDWVKSWISADADRPWPPKVEDI